MNGETIFERGRALLLSQNHVAFWVISGIAVNVYISFILTQYRFHKLSTLSNTRSVGSFLFDLGQRCAFLFFV
jgi:hypothetical protein